VNKQYEKFLETLLERRQIPLQGSIDKESFGLINHSIMYLNAQNDTTGIILLINSTGGSVRYGLDVYDSVASSSAPVTGIVTGVAQSMAAVILQGCTKRIVTPHSEMVVHNIGGEVEVTLGRVSEQSPFGDLDVASIRKSLEQPLGWMQNICKILVDRTGRSAEEVIEMMNADQVMTAQQALNLGLIDEIAEFKQ